MCLTIFHTYIYIYIYIYIMDGLKFDLWHRQGIFPFSKMSRLVLGHNHLPGAFSSEVKQPWTCSWPLTQFMLRLQMCAAIPAHTLSVCLLGMRRGSFTLTFVHEYRSFEFYTHGITLVAFLASDSCHVSLAMQVCKFPLIIMHGQY